MTDTKNYFRDNLNRLIREKGVTQKEVADFIGVSTPTMNYYVKGIGTPRMDKLDKLCTFFNCTKADLLEPALPDVLGYKPGELEEYKRYIEAIPGPNYKVLKDNEKIIIKNPDSNIVFANGKEFCDFFRAVTTEYESITKAILYKMLSNAIEKYEIDQFWDDKLLEE